MERRQTREFRARGGGAATNEGVPTQHLRLKLVLGPCFTFVTSVASCLICPQQWHPTMNLFRMTALIARPDPCWTLSRWTSIVLVFKSYVANCVLQKPLNCRLWRCQKICILSTWNGVCTIKENPGQNRIKSATRQTLQLVS